MVSIGGMYVLGRQNPFFIRHSLCHDASVNLNIIFFRAKIFVRLTAKICLFLVFIDLNG